MYGLSKRSLAFWILLASTAASYGQAPTPPVNADKPKQQAASPQKKATTDQRGTDQAPLVIKILSSTKDEEAATTAKTQHENDTAHWLWKQWLEHWPEILLALFTLGLWIATAMLVSSAKDTARRQLRAYISITGGELVQKAEGGEHFGFEVHFKNAGQTPAYDMVSGTRCTFAPFPRTDALPTVPISEKSRSTIGPGVISHLLASRSAMTPEERTAIENRTGAIYIHGQIEYRDAFTPSAKKPKITSFNLIYRKEHTGRYIIGNDRDGNDAT